MSRHHFVNGPPRARPRPIVDAADALALISLAMHSPLQHEVIAFLLDEQGVGGTIVVVTDATDDDAVGHVVQTVCLAADRADLRRLVVASVRPDGGLKPGDLGRWFDADDSAVANGIRLIEWYVIGPDGAECPRDLIGESDRW